MNLKTEILIDFAFTASASHSSLPSISDSMEDLVNENMPLASFLDWYYSPVPEMKLKRRTIEQRLEYLMAPIISGYRKNEEKATARRNKRRKTSKDKSLKLDYQLNKSLADFKAKGAQRLQRAAVAHQQRQDGLRRARHDRRRIVLSAQ
jgi:hypothetical protein